MSKKMMLLALSVAGLALFALPAVASATPAHISATEAFTVSPGPVTKAAVLETTGGEKLECINGMSGSGSWHSTTTGTVTVELHGCRVTTPFGNLTCTSHVNEGGTGIAGTISTTKLVFHVISVVGIPLGTWITPNSDTNAFAHFTCGGGLVQRTWTGNGLLDTITSPACGTASTTATLKLEQGASTGMQKHTTYTGTNIHLESGGTKAALIAESQMHFAAPKTFTCT